MLRYIEDKDLFIEKRGHPLLLLEANIQRYIHGILTEGVSEAEDCRRFAMASEARVAEIEAAEALDAKGVTA